MRMSQGYIVITYFRGILILLHLVAGQVINTVTDNGGIELWRSLLINHREWIGVYSHDLGNFYCSWSVKSVGADSNQLSYVTFTAEQLSVDMAVRSVDGYNVIFQESSTWNKSEHFKNHTNLEFRGQMRAVNLYYHFSGNVSSDEVKNFGTVNLRPAGRVVRKHNQGGIPPSLKYGLTIGVPVVFAILLTTAGILILYWAVKRGYLRHIPWAYKNFRNPKPKSTNTQQEEPNIEMEVTASDGTTPPESPPLSEGAQSAQISQPSDASSVPKPEVKTKTGPAKSKESSSTSTQLKSEDISLHI